MAEVEQTLEEELEAAIETRQEFRDLLKSPAWDRLVKIVEHAGAGFFLEVEQFFEVSGVGLPFAGD